MLLTPVSSILIITLIINVYDVNAFSRCYMIACESCQRARIRRMCKEHCIGCAGALNTSKRSSKDERMSRIKTPQTTTPATRHTTTTHRRMFGLKAVDKAFLHHIEKPQSLFRLDLNQQEDGLGPLPNRPTPISVPQYRTRGTETTTRANFAHYHFTLPTAAPARYRKLAHTTPPSDPLGHFMALMPAQLRSLIQPQRAPPPFTPIQRRPAVVPILHSLLRPFIPTTTAVPTTAQYVYSTTKQKRTTTGPLDVLLRIFGIQPFPRFSQVERHVVQPSNYNGVPKALPNIDSGFHADSGLMWPPAVLAKAPTPTNDPPRRHQHTTRLTGHPGVLYGEGRLRPGWSGRRQFGQSTHPNTSHVIRQHRSYTTHATSQPAIRQSNTRHAVAANSIASGGQHTDVRPRQTYNTPFTISLPGSVVNQSPTRYGDGDSSFGGGDSSSSHRDEYVSPQQAFAISNPFTRYSPVAKVAPSNGYSRRQPLEYNYNLYPDYPVIREAPVAEKKASKQPKRKKPSFVRRPFPIRRRQSKQIASETRRSQQHRQTEQTCPRQPGWQPCVSKVDANRQFSTCCRLLDAGCRELCNYDLTQIKIELAVLSGACGVSGMASVLRCASGGNDATPCCAARGVLADGRRRCRAFCNPSAAAPSSTTVSVRLSDYFVCLSQMPQITHCFRATLRPEKMTS